MSYRIVIVPKDKNAGYALDYNEATKDQLIEFVLEEDKMHLLFKAGVFELINNIGNIIIDDYEDDHIAGKEKLQKVRMALEVFNQKTDIVVKPLVKKLVSLFEEAIKRDTGVYFYF